jgi:hypothetical protein
MKRLKGEIPAPGLCFGRRPVGVSIGQNQATDSMILCFPTLATKTKPSQGWGTQLWYKFKLLKTWRPEVTCLETVRNANSLGGAGLQVYTRSDPARRLQNAEVQVDLVLG